MFGYAQYSCFDRGEGVFENVALSMQGVLG